MRSHHLVILFAVAGLFLAAPFARAQEKEGATPVSSLQIVRNYEAAPTLKAFIVGHTDNVGTLETNLTLSAGRAEALVKALVSRGIAATRLKAAGVGPYSPVASNKDEQGRAQNRRVELVEQ